MPHPQDLPIREAATWFARMHGPDAPTHEAAFAAWIAESDGHRVAYSQVAEAFSLGKNLPRAAIGQPDYAVIARRPSRRQLVAAAVVALAVIGTVPVIVDRYVSPPAATNQVIAHSDHFATGLGEIRAIRLTDGSTVVLDTGSELNVTMDQGHRDLWLVHGRARFDVAHEQRPFVVHAGTGIVTAHGTLFDVLVEHGHASVRLLLGAIDVAIPGHSDALPVSRHVAPGESVAFDAASGISPIPVEQAAAIAQPTWPSALLEFDRARVADVIAQSNRYAAAKLVAASPNIAERRVSGTFRMGDPDRLAQELAILLDAEVSHQANGDIVIREAAP